MARYSREQRRCAVELYERYEHSAADVIRELGYPSKEALLMWYREWLEERRTGVPSRRGERYARYTDEQKRAAVDHYLTHGRRLSRTMRRMGYPSHEVLAAWIDELAPGERVIRRGPVADGVRRMAVARLTAGGVTSRQVAAEGGVEASVVRNWKRQLLHEPVPEDDPVTPDKPGKRNDGAADPDASDLDGLIAERDRVRAELERIRREKREAEIELAILKGALELVGKERGADPDNLTNREKTILVRTIGAGHGVPVGRLLARVGLARSTYYHQLNAMNRPDRVWTIRCCFGWMWRRRAWTRRTARSWRSGCVGRIRVWTVWTAGSRRRSPTRVRWTGSSNACTGRTGCWPRGPGRARRRLTRRRGSRARMWRPACRMGCASSRRARRSGSTGIGWTRGCRACCPACIIAAWT